jgi:hypothetical protein
MYGDGKMRPVETIPEVRERGIKENAGGGELSMMYLIYCKNFCICYNVLLPSKAIQKLLGP